MDGSQTVAQAAAALIRDNPDATVSAIGATGRYVPIPPSLSWVVPAESPALLALEAVTVGDRIKIVEAWDRARERGISAAKVTLDTQPPLAAMVYLFDLRQEHGVMIGVGVPHRGHEQEAAAPSAIWSSALEVARAPRVCRVHKDELGIFLELDQKAERMLQLSGADTIGQRSLDFVHPDDQGLAISAWMQMISTPGLARRIRLRHLRGDGSYLWVEITNTNLLTSPEFGYVQADMVDISQEMAAHEEVSEHEQLLRVLAETLPVGVFRINSRHELIYSNALCHELLGMRPVGGLTQLLGALVDRDQEVWRQALADVLTTGAGREIEVQVRSPGQRLARRRCTVSFRAVLSPDGTPTGAVGCVQDVTDAVRLRRQLEQRATYDPLTGCLNRATILARLEAMRATQQPGFGTAVIFADLDGFKKINDVRPCRRRPAAVDGGAAAAFLRPRGGVRPAGRRRVPHRLLGRARPFRCPRHR